MDPTIADHGLIGDGRSAALVSRAGVIDWLCWPRFDSPPLFTALLDAERGGSWRIAPIAPARIDRKYIEHTNVLETRFSTETGVVTVTDLMTVASEEDKRHLLMPDHELVRRIHCERGEVEVDVTCDVRPDFGRRRVRARDLGALGIRWEIGTALLVLRGDRALAPDSTGAITTRCSLRAGETATFSLTFDEEGPAVLPPLGAYTEQAIERTIEWWRSWAARAHYTGPHRECVLRSALALKLLSYAPSGAIIAAPTTSLPEREGGPLNWDYRFCWLRDASFTARVLLDLGYTEDAEAFCSWLLHATRLTRPELRVLYDVYGNQPEPEREIADLRGYHGSRPVRVGNLAFDQLQLDTFGEVIDATAQVARVTGVLDRETQQLLHDFGGYVCRNWHRPDAGIWEPRDELRHRTHSRLCCWVALDRLLFLHEQGLLQRIDASLTAQHRAEIRDDIEQHAFDSQLDCYTSELGPSGVDASSLLMSWYGFHPAGSPRMRSTYAQVQARLGAGPGLLYRYEADARAGEGAFWICSFWAVEHLVRGGGSLAQALRLFEQAHGYGNDLGLMAEEVDPRTGEQLGNFPQAYTHVGLISAALSIDQHAQQPEARAPKHELARHHEVRT